jgi:hypothetical protein
MSDFEIDRLMTVLINGTGRFLIPLGKGPRKQRGPLPNEHSKCSIESQFDNGPKTARVFFIFPPVLW